MMRTTLTLDPDVAALAERMRRARGQSLKAIVNEALRNGLRTMAAPSAPAAPYRTPVVDLGRCRLGSLDDIADVLAAAEGEEFR
ncbi:MAG: ribbon-helix-helix protein, CopG family [Acidobacteria bacterium]|nr:ribbon-helix-helix protein, CopG family [Acidobacteriota bacterium]